METLNRSVAQSSVRCVSAVETRNGSRNHLVDMSETPRSLIAQVLSCSGMEDLVSELRGEP